MFDQGFRFIIQTETAGINARFDNPADSFQTYCVKIFLSGFNVLDLFQRKFVSRAFRPVLFVVARKHAVILKADLVEAFGIIVALFEIFSKHFVGYELLDVDLPPKPPELVDEDERGLETLLLRELEELREVTL